ncbi:response regulator [Bremerella sp. JC770]|uniref:response regulator n=1 Tax=Bremerella sp. JC770 TaxID=3232137 RepID=UPI0034575C43
MNAPVEVPKVLLIEDDSVFRMLVKRLVGDDFLIDEASNIESARSLLTSHHYQCVLLDYRLPDGTGFVFLPDAIAYKLPVVMMTAMGHEQLAIDALKQGCQDYLVKDDLDRATLCRSLANAIRQVQADRQIMRQRLMLQKVIQEAASKCRHATTTLRQDGDEDSSSSKEGDPFLDQLDHLMDGLSAYARLASASWKAQPVSLAEEVEHAVAEMKHRLSKVTAEDAGQSSTTFKSDPEAIRSICRGLLEILVEDGTEAATIVANSGFDHGQIVCEFVPKTDNIESLQSKLSAGVAVGSGDTAYTAIDLIRLLVEQLHGTLTAEENGSQVRVTVEIPNLSSFDALSPK